MKIKMLVSRAGFDFTDNRGDVIEVDDAEALRMIEAGQAEAVREAAKPETAVKQTRKERAVK